jgi:hypothetical protein
MIRHDYTGCTPCHADPSGGGILTAYGRAQGELLLSMTYGKSTEDPGPGGEFLWGLVKLPPEFLLEPTFRSAYLNSRLLPSNGAPVDSRYIQMLADVRAELDIDRVRLNGSIGYSPDDALQAAITHRADKNLVSREHWIGYDIGKEKDLLLRAGRIPLPFGIRDVEHPLWVRNITRTDIRDNQQDGVALAYHGEGEWRGELMLIAGNFQINPDEFRERGYSGYLEHSFNNHTTAGISSLVTRAAIDQYALQRLIRQAHGVFGRWAVAKPVVLLAEFDMLLDSYEGKRNGTGFVSALQADYEVIQGLHLMGFGELYDPTAAQAALMWGTWGTIDWFMGFHSDLRLDTILRGQFGAGGAPETPPKTLTLLAQFHIYL